MTLDIEQFNPAIANLQKLVQEANAIEVTDVSDPEQIKVSKKKRLELRDARVSITKRGKELRESALTFQKAVIAKEKEIVGIVEPAEERLQAFEDEAAIAEEKKRRVALLPARKAKLDEIKDDLTVSDDEIIGMDDAAFNAYHTGRAGEKNRKDREDIERRERELREKEEQQGREERARAERQVNERIQRCVGLGLKFLPSQNSYVLDDINVALVDMKTMTDEDFDNMFNKVSAEVNRRKEVKAAEDEERRKKDIAEAEERARTQERERVGRETREREEKERLERERREQDAAYQMFLETHGYTDNTKDDFTTIVSGNIISLFKKVGEFKK